MRVVYSLLFCAVTGSALATPPPTALNAPAPAASIATLETVTVTGVLPGPALWKVSRGDHVLWLLGTPHHLPAHMQWRSAEVERVIAASQEVLEPPEIKLKADVGFFHKLWLLPAAFSARKIPHGLTLHDVLPPPMYARWQRLKRQYLGDDRSIERWRPIFVAMKLEKAALKQHGLRKAGEVQDTVNALAEHYGVKRTSTSYTITVEHPGETIAAFKRAGPRDITCLARTLSSVEHDLPTIGARARAWAVGDLAALRAMPNSHYHDACVAALAAAGFAQQLGVTDAQAQLDAHWLAAAQAALEHDTQSFGLVPMNKLLAPDGLLAQLQAEGYRVVAPDLE